MWLGEIFVELGFQAAPALHCRQALALTRQLNLRVSLVVMNPYMTGATAMIKKLSESNPGLRVILIRDAVAHSSPSHIQARWTLERPKAWGPISRPEWIAKIKKLLVQTGLTLDRERYTAE